MSSDLRPDAELTSWKAIADHLGVNVRTAQKWELQRGLPVHRVTGEKGRVFALAGELDRWRARSAEAPRLWNSLRFWRFYAAGVTLVAVIATAFLVTTRLANGRKDPPSLFRIQHRTLLTTDAAGRETWRHTFDEPLSSSAYNGDEGQQRVWFGDLEGDGRTETLFVYYPGRGHLTGTTLICFAEDGTERWRFSPGVVSDPRRTHPPHYIVSGFMVRRQPDGKELTVAVTSRHAVDHPNHFTILNARGEPQGEYWHSGHLDYMEFADLDGDGREEVLLSGVSNGFSIATLVVLDSARFAGVSDEGPGSPYQLAGGPRGPERAVLLFPRSCISRRFELYNMSRQIRISGKTLQLSVFERPTDPGSDSVQVLYTLDFRLNLLAVQPTDYFLATHRRLEAEGTLNHPFDDGEARQLRELRYLKPLSPR